MSALKVAPGGSYLDVLDRAAVIQARRGLWLNEPWPGAGDTAVLEDCPDGVPVCPVMAIRLAATEVNPVTKEKRVDTSAFHDAVAVFTAFLERCTGREVDGPAVWADEVKPDVVEVVERLQGCLSWATSLETVAA